MTTRPGIEEIEAAAKRISDVVLHTPLIPLNGVDDEPKILLKPEILQPVTNFKIRGVYNAVARLPEERRSRGLSTVSAGNTAQALAWTGRRFGVETRSLMPDTAPRSKIAAVERYGGIPVLVPNDELFRFLRERLWEREPYAFIHPWIDRDVMIGHGTIGLEILHDLPEVETVYVPVGGGGLIGGVASAIKTLKPAVRIVAVEPAGCPALHESFRRGEPRTVRCRTMCDGVAVPYITDEVFSILRGFVDEVVLVTEEEVVQAIRRLARGNRMIVEGSGALSVAAAVAAPVGHRGLAVALVTGGSIDTPRLVEILGSG